MRQCQCKVREYNGFENYEMKCISGAVSGHASLSIIYHRHGFRWHSRNRSEPEELKQLQCLLFGKGLASSTPLKENSIQGNLV